jgi:hypothetical protein
MKITAKEREMLEKERDEIKRLTKEIIELQYDPNNSTKLKQNVIGIQASLGRMASYANPKNYDLDRIVTIAENVLTLVSTIPPIEMQDAFEQLIRNPSQELRDLIRQKLKTKPDILFKVPLNANYPAWWGFAVDGLDKYCCYVNSITFDFANEELRIKFPKMKNIINIAILSQIFNKF